MSDDNSPVMPPLESISQPALPQLPDLYAIASSATAAAAAAPVTDADRNHDSTHTEVKTESVATVDNKPMTVFLRFDEQQKKYMSPTALHTYGALYTAFTAKYPVLNDDKLNNPDVLQFYVKDKEYGEYSQVESYTDEITDGAVIEARLSAHVDIAAVEPGEVIDGAGSRVKYVIDKVGEGKEASSRAKQSIKKRSRSPSPPSPKRNRHRDSRSPARHRSPVRRHGGGGGNDVRDIRDIAAGTDVRDVGNSDVRRSFGADEHVVRLSGLPYSVTDHEILHFLHGVRIPNMHNDLLREVDSQGRFSGIAYVNVASQDDVDKAKQLAGRHIGKQFVKIVSSSAAVRDRAVPKPVRAGGGGGGNAGVSGQKAATTKYVKLSGLPYEVTESQIRTLLHDVRVDAVYLCTKNGRGTGVGYVECADVYSAQQAMRHDREKIGWRYVEMFVAKRSDIDDSIDAGYLPRSHGGSRNGGAGEQHSGGAASRGRGVTDDATCLRMYGLAPEHTQSDITSFFASANVTPTRIHRKPGGDMAYIEFGSAGDAARGLQLNKAYIGKRWMELRPVPYAEVSKIVGLPPKQAGADVVQPQPPPAAVQYAPVQQQPPYNPIQSPPVPTHQYTPQPPSQPHYMQPPPQHQYQPTPQPSMPPQFDAQMYAQYQLYMQQQQQQQYGQHAQPTPPPPTQQYNPMLLNNNLPAGNGMPMMYQPR